MFKKCIFLAILAFPCLHCGAHTLAEKLVHKFWDTTNTRVLDRFLSYAFQGVDYSGPWSKAEELAGRATVLSYSISHLTATRTRDQIIVTYYVNSRQQAGSDIYEYNGYRADVFTKVDGKWKMVLHTILDSVI